jgi:UDP-glucose 4-epimerase
MKVLITGGAGFIGSHLTETYLETGYEVIVVDKKKKPDVFKNYPKIIYYQIDICDPNIENIFSKHKPDIVNHHAALINVFDSLKKPTEYTKTNVWGTIRLLELSKKYKVKQFLFASSVAVYGDVKKLPITENQKCQPISFYGLDKLIAEYYINLFQKEFAPTIFRYSNVYGPRQTSSAEGGVVAIFCNSLSENKQISIYGDGNQARDFVYVKDVVRANIMASQKKISGVFHVSTNQKTSINKLYKIIAKNCKSDLKPKFKPARKGDIYESILQNTEIKKSLNWQPKYNLEKGIMETTDYFENKI